MNARTQPEENKRSDLSRVRPHIGCPYCKAQGESRQAYVLTSERESNPRWRGWVRYGCGGHKFAVPEHTVAMRRAA